MGWGNGCNINELVGLTLTSVEVNRAADCITFASSCGQAFQMLHHQSCCESVTIEDIEGDIKDLIGLPIVVAEIVQDAERKTLDLILGPLNRDEDCDSSTTWTYYRIATAKGWVVFRWFGSSNGYYSEEVDFERIPPSE